jgi:hypothetical protein
MRADTFNQKGGVMRWSVLFSTVFLLSCAPAPAADQVQAAPKLRSVGAEVKSWGVTLRSWTVDAAGHVEHSSGGRPGMQPSSITIEVRRFTLAPSKSAGLTAAVARVEAVLARPEHCDQKLTDGPYGTFSWDEGAGPQTLRFDGNCVNGRDAELAEAIFAADKIVDDAAKAVEPVERRPYAQER